MADGDAPYAGFPYAGGSPVGLGTPVTPDGPSNNLENVADGLNRRLGCGVPAVFVSFRCSTTVCSIPLESITDLQWNRKLNEISTAQVSINVVGDAFSACCQCLAEVEPWCHELHIWRDGKEQWVGPIQQIVYSYEQVEIFAKDVLSWLEVNVPPGDVDYTANPLGYDLVEIGEDIVSLAFVENEFACEIPYINAQTGPLNVFGHRFYPGFTGTAFDFFDALADSDARFFYTTIGRTIFIAAPLSGQPINLFRLALLTDEHIMGDITVTKDGDLQGNRFYVHWDGDLGVPEVATASEMYCSGPVERLRDGEGLVTEADAQDSADQFVADQTIAPRILQIPAGSQLAPETPVIIDELIPGAQFDVSLTKMCVNLVRSFRLTQLEVEYTPEDGEQIKVDLAPLALLEEG